MSSIEYFDSVSGAAVGIPFLEALSSMPSFFHAGIQTTEFSRNLNTHSLSNDLQGIWHLRVECNVCTHP